MAGLCGYLPAAGSGLGASPWMSRRRLSQWRHRRREHRPLRAKSRPSAAGGFIWYRQRGTSQATEREAIAAALATIRPFTLDDLRIVHIRNTLALERLVVSEGCLAALRGREDVAVGSDVLRLGFDECGELLSPLSAGA
jgi:hypothetical protein